MNKNLKHIIVLVTLLMSSPIALASGEIYSYQVWSTTGQTKWRHDASALNSDLGVPTSELDYQDLVAQIGEFSITNMMPNGNQVQFIVGAGVIQSGRLVDDDYLSDSGAASYSTETSAHRFSRTHSDVEGDSLFYMQVGFFPEQMAYQADRINIKAEFGAHYWRESYYANGIRQVECTTWTIVSQYQCSQPGTESYTDVTVISNNVEWTGLGFGFIGELYFLERLKFEFKFKYYPLMRLVNEDTHHLRGDLAQDPSIRMTGTGTGYDLFLGLRLLLSQNLYLHAGYRVWEREVSSETITFYGAGGGSSSADLMNFKTRREGVIGGVGLSF